MPGKERVYLTPLSNHHTARFTAVLSGFAPGEELPPTQGIIDIMYDELGIPPDVTIYHNNVTDDIGKAECVSVTGTLRFPERKVLFTPLKSGKAICDGAGCRLRNACCIPH